MRLISSNYQPYKHHRARPSDISVFLVFMRGLDRGEPSYVPTQIFASLQSGPNKNRTIILGKKTEQWRGLILVFESVLAENEEGWDTP